MRELSDSESRQRCFIGGFANNRATSSERRTQFSSQHRIRKIPGRDTRDDAYRLLDDNDALVLRRRLDRIAVNALAFFCEPLDVAGAVGHFSTRLRQRLALLGCQDLCEVLLRLHQQREPLFQQARAFFGALSSPFYLGFFCRCNRATRFGRAAFGDLGDRFPVSGI